MTTSTQGARISSPCAACGDALLRDVGQFIERAVLRWGEMEFVAEALRGRGVAVALDRAGAIGLSSGRFGLL